MANATGGRGHAGAKNRLVGIPRFLTACSGKVLIAEPDIHH